MYCLFAVPTTLVPESRGEDAIFQDAQVPVSELRKSGFLYLSLRKRPHCPKCEGDEICRRRCNRRGQWHSLDVVHVGCSLHRCTRKRAATNEARLATKRPSRK